MKVVELGSVMTLSRNTIEPEDIPSGTKYVGLEDIEDGEIKVAHEVSNGNLGSTKFLFDHNDVLYGKLRPYLRKVALPRFSGVCSTDILPLRPDGTQLDRGYLYHYLRLPRVANWATARSNGANLPRVSPASLAELKIPLPHLGEQKRIAAILGKADAIRRKRKQALGLADEFLRSLFLDMFGDPVTNSRQWPISQLRDYLSFLTSGSRGWARYYSKEGAKFLRIQNVGRNALILSDLAKVAAPDSAEARRTRVKVGDVLLSITADLGRTAVIPEHLGEAYINQHLALLRVKEHDPLFVSAFLASEGGQKQVTRLNREGVKAGLNFDDIRALRIPTPPLRLQKRFGEIYRRFEALRSTVSEDGSATELTKCLTRRAFAAEL